MRISSSPFPKPCSCAVRPDRASLMLSTAVAFALGGMPVAAIAQAWEGDTTSNWNNAANWLDGIKPDASTDAQIDAGAVAFEPSVFDAQEARRTTVTSGTLTIRGSGQLTSDVATTDTGAVRVNSGGQVVGDVRIGGTGDSANLGTIDGTLRVEAGSFDNAGAVTGATTVTGGELDLGSASDLADDARLAVTGGTVIVRGAETIGSLSGAAGAAVNVAATGTLTVGADNSWSTYDGTLGGSGALTKTGTGRLTLTGDSTLRGPVTVDGGRLILSGAGALDSTDYSIGVAGTLITDGGALDNDAIVVSDGALAFSGDERIDSLNGAGSVALSSGAILTLDAGVSAISGSVGGDGGLTIGAGSDTTLSGTNTNTGPTTVAGGTLHLSNGAAIANTAAVVVNTGTLDVQDAETIGSLAGTGGTVQLGATLTTGGSGASTTYAGTITGAGGLTKVGSGTMTITGTAGMTGVTRVQGGGLALIGAGSVTGTDIRIAAGAELSTDGGALAGGAAILNGGTLRLTAGGDESVARVNGGGAIALSFGSRLTLGSGTSAITGDVSGAGGLTIAAGATARLSGTNTYTDTTRISGGTLYLDGGAAIADGAAVVIEAGQLNVTDAETIGSLAGTGGTVALTGDLTAGGDDSSTTFDGLLTGAGDLVKTGGGTMTLTGASTHDGTAVVREGTLVVTGTLGDASVETDGTLTNTGTMGNVSSAGTTDNTGTMATLTVTDGTATNGGAVTGVLAVTGGTATHTGTAGSASQTGGTLRVEGGTITGATTKSGGALVIIDGTFGGDLTQSAGTILAEGAMTGDIGVSGGSFTLSGATTAGGAEFTLSGGLLDLDGFAYTGLSSLNATGGTVDIGAGTLGAATITNGGTVIAAGGTLTGNVTNTGALRFSGTSNIGGSLSNSGTVSLTDSSGTGDRLTVAGGVSGAGSYALDLNLSDGTADRIIDSSNSTTALNLTFNRTGGGHIGTPIAVYNGYTGTLGAVTHTGLPLGGSVTYSLGLTGTTLAVVSEVNPAVAGIASGAAATQSLINTVVNRPTSPFVSGLAAEEGCSSGGYFRASAGVADISGDSVSNGIRRTTDVTTRFAGAQGGYDWGCFDGRFFDGWDGAAGFMIGYNTGSTKQDVFGLGEGMPATGRTESDFDQKYLGLYLAGSRDRISGDLQLRFDRTSFDLSEVNFSEDVAPVGLDGLGYSINSTTLGARLNYRFDVNEEQGISFVPTVGLNYTRIGGATLALTDGARLELKPYSSIVGFVGGTLTRTRIAESGASATTYFVSGNYYHDFDGDRGARFTAPGEDLDGLTSDITVEGLGGFSEVSAGINLVRVLDNGFAGAKQLNASVRADARFGSNVKDSYSLTAQVRLSF